MHPRPFRRIAPALAVAALALAGSAPAASAAPPAVTTGGAAVTPSTATFTGTVDPQGRSTTYWFEYGTTSRLGARTEVVRAGSGTSRVTAAGTAVNLAANTRYHYRLVARNADGTRRGARRTVRTQRAPLGLSLSAAPNPVPYGSQATLGGVLTGTGNANRRIEILANPFPYLTGFTPVATVTTTPTGTFALPIGVPTITTQLRARLAADHNLQSNVLVLPVAARVTVGTSVGRRRSDGVRIVRFAGRVRPKRDGARYAIQRRSGSRWVTVAGGTTRHDREEQDASRYAERVRVRHSGTYRVYVEMDGGRIVSGTSRDVRIKLRPVR